MEAPRNIQEQQAAFLAAFIDSGGAIIKACADAGVDRDSFFDWLHDPLFDQEYQDAKEAVVDSFEEELHKAIESGNTMALIFCLATKGKDRGYGIDAPFLSEVLNVALEERYRGIVETLHKALEVQGEVVKEAKKYIAKMELRVAELEKARTDENT